MTVHVLKSIEVHFGGDVHRIVVGGLPRVPGASLAEQMGHLRDEADGLRALLLHEARGGRSI